MNKNEILKSLISSQSVPFKNNKPTILVDQKNRCILTISLKSKNKNNDGMRNFKFFITPANKMGELYGVYEKSKKSAEQIKYFIIDLYRDSQEFIIYDVSYDQENLKYYFNKKTILKVDDPEFFSEYNKVINQILK